MPAKPLRFYNPALDPNGAHHRDDKYENPIDDLCTPGGLLPEANCFSSLHTDGLHRPTLDIDIPMVVTPSSTEGHHHVTFPTVALTWERYERLLKALADADIIEPGYLRASEKRRQTILRLPGVKKAEARF